MLVIQISLQYEISQERHENENLWFQKLSIPPSRMVFWFKPCHPLEFPVKVDTSLKKFGY